MRNNKRGKREVNRKVMTPEQIEKKKKKIIRIFITIVIIIAIAIIGMIANEFIILDNNKTTNLIINNKNITANLKNDILIEDNTIYLSKDDIANFFDKYIYEDKDTKQIITTYEKKSAAIGFDKNVITINGSQQKIYAHAIERDNKIYLPISEMKDVYNVEIENIEKTKVITMDSLEKEQKKAIVNSDVSVKSTTDFIAKTTDRIKKGDTVVLVSSKDGYSKVRTENGKLGFVKSDKLDNQFTVRQAMEEEKQIEGKVNLVWDYYSEYASAPDRSGDKMEGVNVVSPSFFFLDKNGNLKENIGAKGEQYIKWAHNNGYKVWPIISNSDVASHSLEITSKIVNSYERRQKLIEDIVNKCVKYKLDGINVDFENMKEEDKNMFSRFIIELTPRLKEIGIVTSVDVTAPDGGETWSMCFDRNVIGHVADYIVFMAYDEYGAYSNKAGTNAGYDWIELNLNKFLNTEEIKSEKIILAVPFYTRVWTSDSNGKIISKNTVAMKDIDKVVPSNAEKKWDDELKQYYVEYNDGSNKKQIWIEDLKSLKEKVLIIKEKNLAGVGFWKKDMESDGVWDLFAKELK